MNKTGFILLSILVITFVIPNPLISTHFNNVYAHLFISDDDASSILTFLEKIRLEAALANSTLGKNSNSSQEHLSKLIKSLDDFTDNENEFVVDSKQFNNSTVNALVLVNILDEVLRSYGKTFGITPSMMTNMSNMNMSSNTTKISSKNGLEISDDDYSVSKQYAKRALEYYKSTLQIFENNDNKNFMNNLGNELVNLNKAIEKKADPMVMMEIVHSRIHPDLQIAFNLTLRQQ